MTDRVPERLAQFRCVDTIQPRNRPTHFLRVTMIGFDRALLIQEPRDYGANQ